MQIWDSRLARAPVHSEVPNSNSMRDLEVLTIDWTIA